jgi:hypothetical protein
MDLPGFKRRNKYDELREKMVRRPSEEVDEDWPPTMPPSVVARRLIYKLQVALGASGSTLRRGWRRSFKYPKFLIELFVVTMAAIVAQIRAGQDRRCPHTWIQVLNAEHHKTPYGYEYWVALIGCRDCDEEWKVQARTPGKFSSASESQVFRDANLP